MATNLTLCQKVGRLIRTTNADASTALTTTVAQTGMEGEIVGFVNDAYTTIQELSPQWQFRRAQGTLSLPLAGRIITLATINSTLTTYQELRTDVAISRQQYILVYTTSIGVSDESECWYVPYTKWRGWFDARTIPTGKPQFFTIRPDRGLEFDRTADVAYTIGSFDYTIAVDNLSGDSDVPIIPTEYTDSIVWAAVMQYCNTRQGNESAQFLLKATKQYNQIYGRMCVTELPQWSFDKGAFNGWL